MEPLAFVAAALFVLGTPALSAVYWLRSRDAAADSVELAAVAYGGVAIAALSIWVSVQTFGLSSQVLLFGVFAGSAAIVIPALVRAGLRAAGSDAFGADDAIVCTGHHDGRVVPDAVTTVARRRFAVAAPAKNEHFRVLSVAGLVFATLAYIPFLPYGWERADGIHRMAMTDWYKHLVTTTALGAADAFPPPNPFLHAAEPAPYYYGFHLVAAAITRLAGSIAGPTAAGELVFPALLLLTLLTAAATPFVAYTVARTVAKGRGGGVGDASRVPLLAALGATFLAGFDLIPLALDTVVNLVSRESLEGGLAGLRALVPSTHLDYWIHHNERQFSAPYLTTIWAPQHMAAVLVALLAIHLVLRRAHLAEKTWRSAPFGVAWLLPAALLAAVPALSAYVAVGLAFGVGGAALAESVRKRCAPWRTMAWRLWLVPGTAAIGISLPVAAVLASGPGPGFVVGVSGAGGWVNGAVLSALFGAGVLTNTVDSVAVYFVEFGALGLLAVLEIRRRAARGRLEPHQRHVIAMIVAIIVLVTFVRPPVGGPNNLYARPLVLVWFLLAPFAAMRVARATGLVIRTSGGVAADHAAPPRRRRPRGANNLCWTMGAILLCLSASAYALVGASLEGALFWSTPPATVEAARWINENAPAAAVIAVHPDQFEPAFGYWLRRPIFLADERHALLFGAAPEAYARAVVELGEAFASASPEVGAARFDRIGTDYIVVGVGALATRWNMPPCFEVVHRNELWEIVRPTTDSCPYPTDR